MYLVAQTSFFIVLAFICIFNFESPTRAIDGIMEDIIRVQGPEAPADLDTPYQIFVGLIFLICLLSLVPLIILLRR